MNLARGAATGLAGAIGLGLGVALGALGTVRRNRPVHPVGTVVPASLILDTPGSTGSPLFDTVGEVPVIVRLSRSASWPIEFPDVMGVAVRIPGGGHRGEPADLLFASTGTGVLTRYVLQLHSEVKGGSLTTMLPLSGPEGNIVFRLDPSTMHPPHGTDSRHGDLDKQAERRFRLSYSCSSGPWESLGELALNPKTAAEEVAGGDDAVREASIHPRQRSNDPVGADDPHLRFRPVAHTPAGLCTPDWLRAARAPAYGIARLVWHR